VVDLFEEVDGRLRSDRYSGLVGRYLPWAAAICGLALVAVVALWGYERYRDGVAEQASQAYADAEDALARGDTGAASLKFAVVAKSGSPIYRTLAQMQQAGIRLSAGDTNQAVQMFDAAAQGAPNQDLADAARLKSALALLDTASLADMETRLTPLADAKRPFHALAREAIAMAKLRAGKFAGAKADFSALITGLDTPDDVRQRAHAANVLIDEGSAPVVAAAAKAALTLPAPPPAMPTTEAGSAQ